MTTRSMKPIAKEEVLAQLKALKPELAQRYGVGQIGVFGFVARNEAHEESDIDVVVQMLPDILKRASLKAELEEKFGRDVDVIRYWHGMNQFLKARIDQEAVYA